MWRQTLTSVISNVPLASHASQLRVRECFRFLKARLHSCHTGAPDDFAASSLSRPRPFSKLLQFPPPPRVVRLSRLLILPVFSSLFPPRYVIYAPPESFAQNYCIQFHRNAMSVGALSHDCRASEAQVRHQPNSPCVLRRGVKYCSLGAML